MISFFLSDSPQSEQTHALGACHPALRSTPERERAYVPQETCRTFQSTPQAHAPPVGKRSAGPGQDSVCSKEGDQATGARVNRTNLTHMAHEGTRGWYPCFKFQKHANLSCGGGGSLLGGFLGGGCDRKGTQERLPVGLVMFCSVTGVVATQVCPLCDNASQMCFFSVVF